MLPYFWYLLKVIICSGILFCYYWLFLRNKIFHQYNRFYLLAAMGLSLLLPLLKINFWQQGAEANQAIKLLKAVSVGDVYMDTVVITANSSYWNFQNLYLFVYCLVSLVFLLILIRTLFIIRTLLKKYPVQQIEDVTFVNTNDDSTPFSFLKYIFWNSSIDMNTVTGRQIFKHEIAHIQEKHTYDKLFVNTTLIFCWCNPFFWLYRKELNMIHEFIADKKAVEDGDTAAFANMILQTAYPKHRFELTNNFFYSPIKRRLLMLTKMDNPRVSYFVRLMVLPLAIFVFAAFTFKAKKNEGVYHGKKITVVIDAGHGGKDHGAKSADGIYEKDLTLALAKKIKALNTNESIDIVLTRDEDIYQSPQQKAAIAETKNADILISLHIGGSAKPNTKTGIEFFVARNQFENTEKSKVLASSLIRVFENNFPLPVTKSPLQREQGIWIVQANNIPSVLIEAGYITNEADVAYLKTDKAKQTIAKNVLAAIENFVNAGIQTALQPKILIRDTVPSGMFINTKYADTSYFKTEEFKTKALVIIDSKEIGNVGNDYVEKNKEKYSTYVVYNPAEAKKAFGVKGKYGVIKLTQNDAMFISANTIIYDKANETIKLTGAGSTVKGNLSNSLIYLEDKIISPEELNNIQPEKISSINILKGDKLNDITDAKGKTSVIYISLKADDLPEVFVQSTSNKIGTFVNVLLDKTNLLYIGIDNPITVVTDGINEKDLAVTISQGRIVNTEGKLYAFVSYPGKAVITVQKRDNPGITKSFEFDVRRVPNPNDPDFPEELKISNSQEPKIYLGSRTGGDISLADLKAQKEIRVTRGYTLHNAMVYFAGPGFENVVTATLNSTSLSAYQVFFNRCQEGTRIVFDNIHVKDKNGVSKKLSEPQTYIVADNSITGSSLQNKAADAKQNSDDNKIFIRSEVAPDFPGGDDAWRFFLQQNLDANTPVNHGAQAGKYTVLVKFIVNSDGSIRDVKCENDPGYGMCEEAVRVIKKATNWIPAIQNGKKVTAYKKQPITFVVKDKIKTTASNIYSVPLKVHLTTDGKVDTYNMVGNGTFTVKPG